MKKDKKSVLYISNVPAPYRVDFFNELGRKVELDVVFEERYSFGRDKSWHKFDFKNFKVHFINNSEKINSSKNVFKTAIFIKNFFKKYKYDIIVLGGYSTIAGMLFSIYFRFKKIPYILNADGGLINKKERKFKYKLKRFFISSASFWLSTGKLTNLYLEYYGAEKNKIYIYPFTTLSSKNILEKIKSKEEKEQIKKELKIKEEKMILCVGRFIYIKGIDTLLKAAKLIPKNVAICIVGGNAPEEYLALKNDLNLTNVYFLEFMESSALKKYYLSSDIFVLPTRGDIWGLVINEALAHGLPVITTNKCVSGLELVSNEKNGFIVDVDNPKKLYDKIMLILNDKLKMSNMSFNSLKTSKNYTIENMAKVHNEIFNYIIKTYK